jgi:hypothetical protein
VCNKSGLQSKPCLHVMHPHKYLTIFVLRSFLVITTRLRTADRGDGSRNGSLRQCTELVVMNLQQGMFHILKGWASANNSSPKMVSHYKKLYTGYRTCNDASDETQDSTLQAHCRQRLLEWRESRTLKYFVGFE